MPVSRKRGSGYRTVASGTVIVGTTSREKPPKWSRAAIETEMPATRPPSTLVETVSSRSAGASVTSNTGTPLVSGPADRVSW